LSTAVSHDDFVGLVYFDPRVAFPDRPISGQAFTISRQLHVGRPWGSFDVAQRRGLEVQLQGWVVDPEAFDDSVDISVSIDGAVVGVYPASVVRNDVAALYPTHGPHHGFDLTVASTGTTACITAVNVGSGSDRSLGCRPITVVDSRPFGSFDTATRVSDGLRVRGWMIDLDSPSQPVTVHVWVDGAPRMALTADQRRDDVGAAFGLGSFHGFDGVVPLSPGGHDVCIFGLNDYPPGGNALIECRRVTVLDSQPFGALDAAVGVVGGVDVTGWMIDLDAPSQPVTVHVWVDGAPRMALTADQRRDDVAAAFGLGSFHGFDGVVAVSPGLHDVCVFGLNDFASGGNSLIACRKVLV